MPTDRTVVTISPAPKEARSAEGERDPIQYLSRAQEQLNLNFASADVVDGKLVMEYNSGGGARKSAEWDAQKVAKMADRVAVVSFSDEGWALGDAYRAFRSQWSDEADLNQVKSFDGEDEEEGEDVLDGIEALLGFRPVRNL